MKILLRIGLFLLSHLVRLAVITTHGATQDLNFALSYGTPDTLNKVNFYLDVVHDSGPNAGSYYGHNFNFKTTTGRPLMGCIGLNSTNIFGGSSYALVSLQDGDGEVVSMQPGPDTKCCQEQSTTSGHVASCVITNDNSLGGGIREGDNFRIYIESGEKNVYKFGIENLTRKKNNLLGQVTFTNVIGINSHGLSHFLKWFNGNSSDCNHIPHTAYIAKGPVGYLGDDIFLYQVVPNATKSFSQCRNITIFNGNKSAIVDFSKPKHRYTPVDLGCNGNGNPCSLNTVTQSDYEFDISDSNWSSNLKLPQSSLKNSTLSVSSHATYKSAITSNDGGVVLAFPFGAMRLSTPIMLLTNDQYTFVNRGSSDAPAWEPSGSSFRSLSPNENGTHIPGLPRLIVYKMQDGNWNMNIFLPDKPIDKQLIIIHSDAGYNSQLHSSDNGSVVATLTRGKTVVYQYDSGKWKEIDWSPVKTL